MKSNKSKWKVNSIQVRKKLNEKHWKWCFQKSLKIWRYILFSMKKQKNVSNMPSLWYWVGKWFESISIQQNFPLTAFNKFLMNISFEITVWVLRLYKLGPIYLHWYVSHLKPKTSTSTYTGVMNIYNVPRLSRWWVYSITYQYTQKLFLQFKRKFSFEISISHWYHIFDYIFNTLIPTFYVVEITSLI